MTQFALITGGSTGIGYELASLFARDGYGLILVARDKARLESAAESLRLLGNGNVTTVVADLSLPGTPQAVYEKYGSAQIDAIVNCAGIAHSGDFFENTLSEEHQVVATNVVALVEMTRLFGMDLVSRGGGKILNVASLAAFQPGPHLANYYATKAFVLSFSEALSREVREQGVTVTALCPGTTVTGFHRSAKLENTDLAAGLFGIRAEPRDVALAGYEGLFTGKSVVVPGLVNKIAATSVRLAPRALATFITSRINRRRTSARTQSISRHSDERHDAR